MTDDKDTTTEALVAGAIKAYEDEVINGREYNITVEDAVACVRRILQSPDPADTFNPEYLITITDFTDPFLTGFVQSLDPPSDHKAEWRVHWTIPSVYEQEGAPPSVSTTHTSDLTGLAAHTHEHTAFRDYVHWDRCVREEAARQLEVPRNAAEYLNKLGRALESLDDLIEALEEELDEEGFDFHAKFGYINMDLQRMYENLRLAEEALDSVNSQVDYRLPALLRDGTRKHALVSNPYPQHKDARE